MVNFTINYNISEKKGVNLHLPKCSFNSMQTLSSLNWTFISFPFTPVTSAS